MSFNSSTVTLGESTKKSHFDQLLSNTLSILKDPHTFLSHKQFSNSATFNGPAYFHSGTVFSLVPTLPAGSIGSSEIENDQVNSQHYAADSIDEEHINWGTGAGQISTNNILSGTLNKFMRQGVTQTFTGDKNFSGTVQMYSSFKADTIAPLSATDSVAITAVYRSATSSIETTIILKQKVIAIGDWNMDSTTAKNVAHGMGGDWLGIRSIQMIIRNDDDAAQAYFRNSPYGEASEVWFTAIGSTTITLARKTDGIYDDTDYDDIGYNRGWIYIVYQPQ